MTRKGALVHVRHPDTIKWQKLVWGVPEENQIGDLTKLVELVLREDPNEPFVVLVLGTTVVTKDGVLEGEYTKQYLLKHFKELWEFPRLRKYLDKLTEEQITDLKKRLEGIVITQPGKNTLDEIRNASHIFKDKGVHEVIQVTAASHGPRCIQQQGMARMEGYIPLDQTWYVTITDICFQDTTPNDTAIMEVPHRGDDPLAKFRPTLPQALKPFYYDLDIEDKKKLILIVDEFMKQYAEKDAGRIIKHEPNTK